MGYLDGFRVTFKKLFEERLTRDYSKDEGGKRVKPARLHGRHVLNRYEDGMEKCIGCELCAGVCPARCIYVRGADNPPDDPVAPGERYGYIYEINYLRCIHCDLCVEACPTEAITESKLFEFSFTNRGDAIYTKAELVVGDDGKPWRIVESVPFADALAVFVSSPASRSACEIACEAVHVIVPCGANPPAGTAGQVTVALLSATVTGPANVTLPVFVTR